MRQIKYLVLHHLPVATFDMALAELAKHQVSAHYVINTDGQIYQLVSEKDIAFHAGHSYWAGNYSLNRSSIGIEFYNPYPFDFPFSQAQIKAGIILCRDIIKRYNIALHNVLGHSDIAYFPEDESCVALGINGYLGRKEDPSYLFPWAELAKEGIGLWPEINLEKNQDMVLLKQGEVKPEVKILKERLAAFGYKIACIDQSFDGQLNSVIKVFIHRFGDHDPNYYNLFQQPYKWSLSLEEKMKQLLKLADIY